MPRPHAADLNPDPTPDGEDEPLATYYREQATIIRHQIEVSPPTDPIRLERLQRDLAYWEKRVAAEDLGGHWEAGEGDRALF